MLLRRTFIYCISLLIAFSLFFACKNKEAEEPDISNMELDVKIRRFDQDLFSLRTDYLKEELLLLKSKYPIFYSDFMENILGVDVLTPDKKEQEISLRKVRKFINDYQVFYAALQNIFPNMDSIQVQMAEGFKYVKYYFPNYVVPQVITFIGPIDAVFQSSFGLTPDIISDSTIGISLLLHTGKDFEVEAGKKVFQGVFDNYILRKFTPETIVSSSFKNIVEDLFPDNSADKTLVEQMVEKGKRMYLLKKLLPHTPDTVLFNYTQFQLKGCLQNERDLFTTLKGSGILYTKDNQVIRNYIGDAPFTPTLSKESPGNIGTWIGYRIVESYMRKNKSVTLPQLMKLEAQTVFLSAKYKPKNHKK